MRSIAARVTLVISLAGCAGQTADAAVATPADAQPPAWQQLMDQARRQAAAGSEYVLVMPSSGVFVFYNNPRPFCYTYMIPGDWLVDRGNYRSKDGRASAAVTFMLRQKFDGLEGATLVERARTLFTREYEKALGQSLAGVELVPFETARPGAWKWTALPVMQGGRQIAFPLKIIVDLSPDAVVIVTVGGASDNDAVGRGVVEAVKMTSDPECYWSLLERMLKSILGER